MQDIVFIEIEEAIEIHKDLLRTPHNYLTLAYDSISSTSSCERLLSFINF